MDTLTEAEIGAAGLTGWRLADGRLEVRYRTGDFATALALLDRVGAAAEAAGHHPDAALGYGYLELHLVSHDAGGVTTRDVDLARTVSTLAAEAGVPVAGG